MLNTKHEAMKQEAIAAIIEKLDGYYEDYYCDLHNEVFNTDYYTTDTEEAKDILREYDVFEAIDLVQTYEKQNFGELYTDLSDPKKLVNMLYYIIGEEVIAEMYNITAFSEHWDEEADEETNAEIIREMIGWTAVA